MTSPLPDELQALAAGYVLGDLSSEEMAQFKQLLGTQPELAQTVAALQDTLSMLPYGLPPQRPDSRVRSRLMDSAAAMSDPLPAPAQPPVRLAPKSPWLMRLAASVAVVMGSFSLWLGYRVVTLQAQLATAEQFVEQAMADNASTDLAITLTPTESLLNQQWSGLLQLVQDHTGSLVRSQGPVDVAATDLDVLSAQLARSEQIPLPALTAAQAQLLGGSPCQFGDAQGVRLTYQLSDNQTVSVYRVDLKGDQFPELSGTYVTLKHHNVNLILWQDQDHLYALAAELPLTDLQILAQTLEPI
jgi:anti-sigma factor RsiW